MSAPQREQALRDRIAEAMSAMPGPDRARMDAIRRGLPLRRRMSKTHLWLAAALLAAGAAAATTAWITLIQVSEDETPNEIEESRQPNDETERVEEAGVSGEPDSDTEREPMESGKDGQRNDPIIIRQRAD